MADYDENDPRLAGYKPLTQFKERDRDRSSRRIRDMPWGKREEAGIIGPAEMNFGTVGINGMSASQTAVVMNTGYGDLPIKGISAVGDFLIQSNCPSSLAPGEACEIVINFNPKREGIITGGVYLDTGDAAGTEFVKLRGTGELSDIPPDPDPEDEAIASYSRSTVAFGNVPINTNSGAESVTLTNTGTERLTISSISAPTGFTQTNNCGSGLDAGASCTINLRFAPTAVGARTGNAVVNHNGQGTKNIALSGTGTGATTLPVITISDATLEERSTGTPSFSVPSTSLPLGTVAFGETAEGTFYVTGSTEGPILLNTLPADGQGFSFAFSDSASGPFLPASSFEIAQGGRMYVRVRCSGAPGSYSRSMTFGSLSQSATRGVTAVIEEEVIPEPVGMKRIRIAGNQFYEAVDENDNGGTLPATGGIRLASTNWHGAEGSNNTPHGTWEVPWRQMLDQIRGWGFNCIRLPFSGTTLTATPPPTAIDFAQNPEFVGKNALQIFDLIIEYCEEIGLYVVLDHHRRSQGDGADGAPTDGSYTLAQWKADWLTLANRYKDNVNVVGADVHNEPHDLTWATWAALVEEVGNHIHTVAPDWIIFCEGVGAEGSDHYWWGGHLKGVRTRPVVLTIPNRVAYSPHEYGQSVGSQAWLKKDGNIPENWPLNLAAIWDEYWGFIFYENIAPLWIGEMGGHFGLNANTGVLDKPYRVEETEWMTHLVRYLNFDKNIDGSLGGQEAPQGGRKGISFAWWTYNPTSADTGGLVQADWVTPQQAKLNLIQPLLDNI